jgi:hypothetical protein
MMRRFKNAWGHGILAGVLALGAAACGGPLHYAIQGTPRAAGADATLDAHVSTEQSNTRLELIAMNLAPPDRVSPGSTMYVVWQRRNSTMQWTRVGTLAYNAGGRRGELHGVTVPETRFEMQITAEPNSTPTAPAEHVVFTQNVGSEP